MTGTVCAEGYSPETVYGLRCWNCQEIPIYSRAMMKSAGHVVCWFPRSDRVVREVFHCIRRAKSSSLHVSNAIFQDSTLNSFDTIIRRMEDKFFWLLRWDEMESPPTSLWSSRNWVCGRECCTDYAIGVANYNYLLSLSMICTCKKHSTPCTM